MDKFNSVSKTDRTIVIWHDGNTTIGKLYDRDNLVKTTRVDRVPFGEYDFAEVSKIVLDDLVEHKEKKIFDWEKFKAREMVVRCTSESWASFVAEARAHGCKFNNDNGVDPFTDEVIKGVKRLMRLLGKVGLSDDEIIVVYESGMLKFLVHRPDDVEIFEWSEKRDEPKV